MTRLALLLTVLSGCAAAPTRSGPEPPARLACESSPERAGGDGSTDGLPEHIARVTLTPEDAGTWLVEYAFAEPESALIFVRSRGDYRRDTWVPLGDGVRIAREGAYDTVLLDAPAASARFRVTPYEPVILGDYSPVVSFSDGGQAVYLPQFDVLRVADAEAAAALTRLSEWRGRQQPFTLVMNTDASLVALGDRIDGPACFDSRGSVRYVYYGPGEIVEGRSYIGVVDPGVPDWIRSTFDDDLRALFAVLERKFGSPLPQRANLLFAYGGRPPGRSLKASVLPPTFVAFEFEGDDLDTPSEAVRASVMHVFAHESAHLFQARDRNVRTAESWIHEGHAEAIAYRLVPEEVERRERHDRSCRQALSSGEPLPTVLQTQAYECGPWVWALADRLAPHDDLYSLWDQLADTVAAERATSEHVLSVLDAAGAGGPDFDALTRALRGEEDIDIVALLDPEAVQK